MRFRNWFLPLSALIAVAALFWWISVLAGDADREARRRATTSLATQKLSEARVAKPFLGSSSCAAARCHGGVYDPERPAWNWAYTVWRSDDRHAQAYADLLSPRGQEMAERFFADEGRTRPEHDQRCLACHVTPRTPDSVALHEGVGCESCHGRSDQWRSEHYLPAWKAARSAEGFHDLRKPSERAKSCVGCHVGRPGQEVNHDLIAAGHPPLRFELGAFHEQLPKHWDFEEEQTQDRQLEARLWLAGQIESSRAALDLLNQRATNYDGPWPELAEYDCESCHHPLSTPGWRQSRRSPGSPLWGSWHFSPRMIDASHAAAGGDGSVQAQLDGLRNTLRNLSAKREDVQPVVQTLRSLWPKSEAADGSSLTTQHWINAIERLSSPTTNADQTFSAAAQRWLARIALDPPEPASGTQALRSIRSHLRVPARFDPTILETLEGRD